MLEDLSEGGIKHCEPRCGNVPLTRKEEFRNPRLCQSACESKRVIDSGTAPATNAKTSLATREAPGEDRAGNQN
jgi:hypothetical protein